MIHVLIVDDHPIVRRGLRKTFQMEGDFVVEGEAANGEEALALLRTKQIHVAVVDLSMPGMNGLELLQKMKREFPRIPFLVLSIHPEEQYALQMLRLGASGYLTKETVPKELVAAVRKVCQGERYLSPRTAERLASKAVEGERLPHERLSEREMQVLRLLASGRTPTQIGQEMQVSIKTVSAYRSRILEKLDLSSNAAMIRYALENGLVDGLKPK